MSEARDWYQDSHDAIARHYGPDTDLFIGLLAATSPRASVKANLTLARKAYYQVKETGTVKREGYVNTHYKCILHVLKYGHPRGRKAHSFYYNLTGQDMTKVTVDIWMMRYAGYNHGVPTSREYDVIEDNVRQEAEAMGITPAQRQAEIWCQIRGNGGSYADLLRQLPLEVVA